MTFLDISNRLAVKHKKKHFAARWRHLPKINGEMFTFRRVFDLGRVQKRLVEGFRTKLTLEHIV